LLYRFFRLVQGKSCLPNHRIKTRGVFSRTEMRDRSDAVFCIEAKIALNKPQSHPVPVLHRMEAYGGKTLADYNTPFCLRIVKMTPYRIHTTTWKIGEDTSQIIFLLLQFSHRQYLECRISRVSVRLPAVVKGGLKSSESTFSYMGLDVSPMDKTRYILTPTFYAICDSFKGVSSRFHWGNKRGGPIAHWVRLSFVVDLGKVLGKEELPIVISHT